MPFKSEKQRKYLWANEPEIARDWTETYGSKVKKADGGISQLVKSGPGRPGYAGPHDNTGGKDYGRSAPSRGMSPGAAQARGLGAQHHGSTRSGNKHAGNVGSRGGDGYVPGIGTVKAPPVPQNQRDGILNKFQNWQNNYNTAARMKHIQSKLDPKQIMKLVELGLVDYDDTQPTHYGTEIKATDKLSSGDSLKTLQDQFDYTGGMLNPADDRGNYPYIYPPIETVSVEETSTPTNSTAGLGSGHFLVPIDYVQNRTRAATGGVMDIVDRESIIKTPDEEIVTNQMEEIEGQTAGPQWYQDRLEHLMFLGYSYEQAGEIAYDSDAYYEAVGHDPYATGGRVGRAFGGIMDTSTGRRKYFGGSFFKAATKPFKKAAKAVKKLASSPLGKLALGYLATSGLAGLGSGTGMQGFYKPSRFMSNIAGSWNRFAPQVLKESTTKSLPFDWKDKAARLAGEETGLLSKGKKLLSNPFVSIPAASAAAGLMTAKMPVEELDQADDEYDAEKEAFDAYLASLGGSYRVPEEYLLAKGGRVAAQEGGLMDMGGMEKDYRNDGGFVPIGGEEKADDVPARLSRNEFVFTADAVRSAGGGDIDKGAEVMENVMKNLEQGGTVSEESQGKGGAQDMFEVSERLSEVM
jgi:hypothetical protein